MIDYQPTRRTMCQQSNRKREQKNKGKRKSLNLQYAIDRRNPV